MERAVYLRKSFSCWKERVLSDSVIFEKDVAIPMREGAVLRANVYRPNTSERFPVILTVGPYGKDLHFEDFDAGAGKRPIRTGGYRAVTWSSASTNVASALPPERSTCLPESKVRIFMMPSNGQRTKTGVQVKLGC